MSEQNQVAFVDEKSIHDWLLSLLAVIAAFSILFTGIYWQSLPLPGASEQSEK